MRYYVIINGVNSLTIQGLAIKSLPPISKPPQRVLREEIDGRDGDITTELGYGAYDKTLEVGLYGSYDIDEVIAFFNSKGTIVFSDEDDKYYNFEITDRIDWSSIIKFRSGTINIHCQPFKYPLTETEVEVEYQYVEGEGETITLDNTASSTFKQFDLLGQTSQDGTPTPDSPIDVNVVSGDNYIDICGKNLFKEWISGTVNVSTGEITSVERNMTNYIPVRPSTQYAMWREDTGFAMYMIEYNSNKQYVQEQHISSTTTSGSFTTSATTSFVILYQYTSYTPTNKAQLEQSSSASTYEPYQGNTYEINLGKNLVDSNLFTTTGSYNIESIDNGEITTNTLTGYGGGRLALGQTLNLYNGESIYLSCKIKSSTYTTTINTIQLFDNNNTQISSKTETRLLDPTISSDYQEYKTKITLGVDFQLSRLLFQHKGSTSDAFVIKDIMIAKSDSDYAPYSTPIELCKIGDYQDYIFKNTENSPYYDNTLTEDTWYLHKEIGKVVLDGTEDWNNLYGTNLFGLSGYLNTTPFVVGYGLSNYYIYNPIQSGINANTLHGEFALQYSTNDYNIFFKNTDYSTVTDFTTWLSTHNTIVYYVLATSTNTEITDDTLLEQLEELKLATSYESQTNISQENNDLPFYLDVSTLELGSDTTTITNNGNIYSKPTLDIQGTGIVYVYLNGSQIFEVDCTEENEIIINVTEMEAYTPDNTLANRMVTGDYNDFKLNVGSNTISFSGALTSATITDYTRYL